MTTNILLITLVVLAIIALNTKKLQRAVVYLGIFSLVSSFLYLLYGAPDVAIAEAVIGTTITTVLYLVALKKYQIFTIYFCSDPNDPNSRNLTNNSQFLNSLESFLVKREMEPQIIYSAKPIKTILTQDKFDLAISQTDQKILIYGSIDDYYLDALEDHLLTNHGDLNIHLIRYTEGDDNEA